MQGHVACQPKSVFFWPDPSQSPDVTAVTAAFPEGGGVIIFIFSPRGNPVKYTDPDGRVGEKANSRSKWLKAEGTKQIGQGNFLINAGTNLFAYLLSNNADMVSQGNNLKNKGEINKAKGDLLSEIVRTGAISKIAHHSYQEGHARELGLQTESDIAAKIDSILADPGTQIGIEINRTTNEYTYGFLANDGTLLIYNPSDEKNNGTIFKPSNESYFNRVFIYDFEDIPRYGDTRVY
jgi:hypothetical protein